MYPVTDTMSLHSSSSSMEGNARENSTGVRKDVSGDEEVEGVKITEQGACICIHLLQDSV